MWAELTRKMELKRETPLRLLWREMTNLSRSGSRSDISNVHVFKESETDTKLVCHNIKVLVTILVLSLTI